MASSTYLLDQGDNETLHLAVKSPLEADALPGVTWVEDDPTTWGPLNIADCKLWLWIKTISSDSIVLEKTTEVGGGITITDAPGGLADVAISASDTSGLDAALIGKVLRLIVQLRSATGKITTLKRGNVTILRDRIIAT